MPERGFEYFPSPESNAGEEVIAHLLLYCTQAVALWPELRDGLFPDAIQREAAERNAIDVFREVRDTIDTALATDNVSLMSDPRLGERFGLACAYLALHAEPASLPAYRSMICGEIGRLPSAPRDAEGKVRDLQSGFELALFEAKWNEPGVGQPATVTRRQSHVYASDGRRDTTGECKTGEHLDPVAKALELQNAGEVTSLFASSEPHNKLPDWLALLRPYSAVEMAIRRDEVQRLSKRAGLPSHHAQFLERLVFEGAKQEDNPAAWHAIRQSRQGKLLAEVLALLESRDGKLFLP